ncbi:MAG TPA: hypothetical protein PKI14_01360 [Fervidobacterium sp.]|nr:hypothetical protein [Fervidobacterium sp.]
MKTISVKQTEDGEAYLDLFDFACMVDVTKVFQCTMEEVDDNGKSCILLKFFDKDNNVLEVK